ncbi:hypothetical protein [Rhizobium sp. RM]|uniref:hypothetical protein n=1 Tax=Rhizobium sp. RM TaxID=2748079 RepID=UPI001FEE1F6B|nr:hypothetical protein [Rhizobium sp. RM]
MPEQIEKLAIAFERFTRRFKVAEAAAVMQNSLNVLDIQALLFFDEHPKWECRPAPSDRPDDNVVFGRPAGTLGNDRTDCFGPERVKKFEAERCTSREN